jgi:hypothetical protein
MQADARKGLRKWLTGLDPQSLTLAQAIEWNIQDYKPLLVAELDIDYILSLQRRIELMQDDEEIELLLTL